MARMTDNQRQVLDWMHASGGLGVSLHTGYRPTRKWFGHKGERIIGLPSPLLRSLQKDGFIAPVSSGRYSITEDARIALGYLPSARCAITKATGES